MTLASKGIGIAAVAALGAVALYYVWRKYQQNALTMRTHDQLINSPLQVTGAVRLGRPVISPPKVIYINPVRLQ